MSREPTVEGYALITVHTSDMERAREFYQQSLGLNEADYDPSGGKAVFDVPGGPRLGVHVWDSWCKDAGGRRPGTVSGVLLAVDDAEAMAQRVQASEGEVTGPIQPRKWADGASAGFIADPDGNEFTLVEA